MKDVLTVDALSTILLLMAIEAMYPGMRFIHVFRKRRKSPGTAAFFSCADSPPWTLYVMCCRHPPFPR